MSRTTQGILGDGASARTEAPGSGGRVEAFDPSQAPEASGKAENPKKKALWSLLFVVIAAATIWAVISQCRSFTLGDFIDYVRAASKPWLLMAVLAALCHVYFEGEALVTACRALGHRAGRLRGFSWAASDIYFSAITPSATGGQPACAWFMIRDGVAPMATTVILLANLVMYTCAILAMGALTLILQPGLFLGFRPFAKLLIVVGCAAQVGLAVIFALLLLRGELLHGICKRGLRLLARLRLLKREDAARRKLAGLMDEYGRSARFIAGHRAALFKVFCCNLIQRAAFIAVPVFVFLAGGGRLADAGRAFALQCYAVLGSNTVPIPGAMGVSDYLMLDGFAELLGSQGVVNFELLSRTISFYACVLLCGVVTLVKFLRVRRARASKR